MKNAHKKAISVLLVAVMVFGAAPLAGFVGLELPGFNLFSTKAKAATSGAYTYYVNNGEAKITGVSNFSGDAIVPSTLDGYPVTSIGERAFEFCVSITSITIPDSVISLEFCSIYRCGNLTSVTIPDSVTSIGSGNFSECEKLTKIIVDKNNNHYSSDEYGVLFNKDKTTLIFYPEGGNTEYKIPSGVTQINNVAFKDCSKLANVTIPNSIENIGHYAFYGCKSLTDISIPSSVTSIGDFAFSHCVKLDSILIPNSVTSIGEDAFSYCYSLESVIIPDDITSISDGMFGACSKLISVTIPESVKSIGGSAFSRCTSLTNIIIPENVRRIGGNAFNECSALEEIIIPYNCSEIDVGAFGDCSNLSKIYIYNKKCSISYAEIPLSTTVYGYADSWAESYANNYGYRFALIDNLCEHKYSNGCDMLCNICGETRENAHDYSEWTVIKEANCYNLGSKERVCLDCGYCDKKTIQVTEHKAGVFETVIEPTVTSFGKKIQRCAICGDILSEEKIDKIVPPEAIVDKNVITNPSIRTINYGDSIVLRIGDEIIPEGGKAVWTTDNSNFTKNISSNGATCTISPQKSGDTTFTATIYDAKGNAVSTDEQTMTSKAGFFDKIIAFFKKLFGLTKVIPQAFKGIY